MNYQTIFQNDHFVVVDKAPNVLSVPSRMGADDPRPCLGRLLEVDLGVTIFPVHRLDFEVQGLIMFALTPAAQKAGNAWFENKLVHKIYSAITQSSGKFSVNETYEWKCNILRGKKRAYESPHGKESVTIAKLIAIEDGFSHWEISPITGRSHQLRYELFRHEETIVGDSLYGSTKEFKEEGIALRAFKIDFSVTDNHEQFLLPKIISIKTL